ncbi:MAG: hypothetical protein LBT36_00440 [Oscillospiraceae bacterium]|nr:hypothetical protein [Oscillospiraceae bacterium]
MSVSEPSNVGDSYTLSAMPNPGYVFDHWEARTSEDGTTWDDSAWANYAALTTASGTATIAAHTQFRAHFRPTAITAYGAEAYLAQFTSPTFWSSHDIPAWYYQDCHLITANADPRDHYTYRLGSYNQYDVPATVGSKVTLILPIFKTDGTLPSTSFQYALYLGDAAQPILNGSTTCNATSASIEVMTFYLNPTPNIMSVRLVVTVSEIQTAR